MTAIRLMPALCNVIISRKKISDKIVISAQFGKIFLPSLKKYFCTPPSPGYAALGLGAFSSSTAITRSANANATSLR